MIFAFLRVTGLRSCRGIGWASTAFGSTISGEYAFDGAKEMPTRWKSRIITRR